MSWRSVACPCKRLGPSPWCAIPTARSSRLWSADYFFDRRGSDQRWYEKAGLPGGCVKLPNKRTRLGARRRPDMKKNTTTAKKRPKTLSNSNNNQHRQMAAKQRLTIGLYLGDVTSRYCILDEAGEKV